MSVPFHAATSEASAVPGPPCHQLPSFWARGTAITSNIHRAFRPNQRLIGDNRASNAFAEQTAHRGTARAALSHARIFRRADRCLVRRAYPADLDPDLDASAAAALGLRQPSGAHARDRHAGEESDAGRLL